MKTTPEDVETLYAVTRNAAENCIVADAAAAVAKLELVRQFVSSDRLAMDNLKALAELRQLLDAPRYPAEAEGM